MSTTARTGGLVPAPRTADHVDPVRVARRPATPTGRWGVRLLLSAPVVALVAHLQLSASGAGGLGTATGWPSPAQLGAAVAAGGAVHSLGERLARRAVPAWLVALLVLTVVATAAALLDVLATPEAILALGLLVVATDGALRFAGTGDTHGGFVAGLLLAGAFVAHPPVLPMVVLLGLVSPLLFPGHHRGEPHARTATVLVLLFPVGAVVTAWSYLQWQLAAGPVLRPELLGTSTTAGQGVVLLVLAGAMAVPASPSRRVRVLLAGACAAVVAAVVVVTAGP